VGIQDDIKEKVDQILSRLAITQAVIYGWYDNEMGSYVNMLGDRVVSIAEHL
jgi:glyceraldehyde 3-phosphate dehydrogenase